VFFKEFRHCYEMRKTPNYVYLVSV
jgi:hypothetical protein